MSQQNVEVVLGMYDDLGRGDFEAVAARLAPRVEWDTLARGSDGAVVTGAQEVVKGMVEWLDAWDDVSFEVRAVRDGGEQIALHVRQHARGKGSGVEGDVEAFACCRLYAGVIVGYREYTSWPATVEALERAGASRSSSPGEA